MSSSARGLVCGDDKIQGIEYKGTSKRVNSENVSMTKVALSTIATSSPAGRSSIFRKCEPVMQKERRDLCRVRKFPKTSGFM